MPRDTANADVIGAFWCRSLLEGRILLLKVSFKWWGQHEHSESPWARSFRLLQMLIFLFKVYWDSWWRIIKTNLEAKRQESTLERYVSNTRLGGQKWPAQGWPGGFGNCGVAEEEGIFHLWPCSFIVSITIRVKFVFSGYCRNLFTVNVDFS